jgi:hypothetical protein
MRLRLASWILWVFVIGTAFLLGAGVYEQLVVVPFWAGDAPHSLMESNPILQVPLRSGQVADRYTRAHVHSACGAFYELCHSTPT